MNKLTPQETKQIAEEAYIFAFSMLENYKTMYVQAVNEALPTYRAPFKFNGKIEMINIKYI
jgi:hypothetical protein